MAMCEACKSQRGDKRTPHEDLIPDGPERGCSSAMGSCYEQDYVCRKCGSKFMHETGNSGYGWIPQ